MNLKTSTTAAKQRAPGPALRPLLLYILLLNASFAAAAVVDAAPSAAGAGAVISAVAVTHSLSNAGKERTGRSVRQHHYNKQQ